MGEAPRERTGGALAFGIIGIVLYVMVAWFYLVSGLVIPNPWYWGVLGVWVVGLYALLRVFREAPAWTPVVPVGAVILLIVIAALGGALLGWTA